MLIDLQLMSFLRNIIAKTLTYRRLPTLLITLLPINIAIQIAMLVNILRPIPINYYHTTIVSITIISDRLHSIQDLTFKPFLSKKELLSYHLIPHHN